MSDYQRRQQDPNYHRSLPDACGACGSSQVACDAAFFTTRDEGCCALCEHVAPHLR